MSESVSFLVITYIVVSGGVSSIVVVVSVVVCVSMESSDTVWNPGV